MASLIRSLIAGPRKPHPESGLDLCYVSTSAPCIVVMSMPATTYPKKAYRTALDDVIKFLDKEHGDRWSMWEFLAEGTEYTDEEVHGRVYHAPWPDHQPPPFAVVPGVMASMRDHLKGGDPAKEGGERCAVLHCKAGKGRSGSMACSYLIAEEGWHPKDALARFTEARMRPGFGEGVSIKSQLRWITYVDKWARELGKVYVEHAVEILEIKIWGLRDKTACAVEAYEDKGKKIKTVHTFDETEIVSFVATPGSTPRTSTNTPQPTSGTSTPTRKSTDTVDPDSKRNVILRPASTLLIPTNDVCITFSSSLQLPFQFNLVTSIAYFWFNAYFHPDNTLSLNWDELDGLKGTYKKGLRTLDRVEITFRPVGKDEVVKEAEPGQARWEEQPGPAPANAEVQGVGEKGGWLRRESADMSPGERLPHTFISPPGESSK